MEPLGHVPHECVSDSRPLAEAFGQAVAGVVARVVEPLKKRPLDSARVAPYVTSNRVGAYVRATLVVVVVVTAATIVCPRCGHAELETMPTNACQFFYTCVGCGVMLRPIGSES